MTHPEPTTHRPPRREGCLPVGAVEIQRTVFIPHSGFSRTVPTIERLAECLAEHGDLPRAAAECGVSHDYAKNLLGQLRKRIGGQAR